MYLCKIPLKMFALWTREIRIDLADCFLSSVERKDFLWTHYFVKIISSTSTSNFDYHINNIGKRIYISYFCWTAIKKIKTSNIHK